MTDDNYSGEGVDPQVSDDAFEMDPVLAKYQTEAEQKRLIEELEASRKERKAFDKTAIGTLKRYADDRTDDELNRRNFNVFYANTDLKMAALYARTPSPDVKRRFDAANDDVSRVAGMLAERNIAYELECGGFDQKFKSMLFDRLVPGFGVGWARLEQDEQEGPITFDAEPGLEVPSEPVLTNQFAEIDYVAWDDFYWAPCTTWTLCRWVARRVPMTKPAVKERFGKTAAPEVLESLTFEKKKSDARTDATANTLKPKNSVEATADIYELWDKEHRVVYWFAEGAELPLDVQTDTNEFPEFFPTPLPPLGRFSTSNTLPISDFKLTQDLYNELDDLNNRCSRLVQALQLRWLYDQSNGALKDLYTTTDELEGIPVSDWAVFTQEKGGIENAVQFAPLEKIATTYANLVAARDRVKAQIYEVEGLSDYQRAASTPYETKAAAEIKTSLGSSRLSIAQYEVADYIARLLRLKFHLICKFYQPEFILKRVGDIAEPDRQLVGPAIQLLKDRQLSHFRLTVSTDSLQLPNYNQEKAEKTQAIQALSNLLPQLVQAAKEIPAMGMFGTHAIKWLVTGFKGAEELEGYLDQALQQMVQQQAQQQGQQKPTPQELEMQAEQQRTQAELQKAQIKGQIDVQVASIQANAKVQAAQLQAEIDAYKNRIKEMEASYDARFRQMELQIEATRAAHENAKDVAEMGAI